MKHFDAIIIGTGQAGPSLAGRFSDAGKTVAIIERHKFGGTCVNTGCIPTKTMVASAYAAHVARRGAEYGFSVNDVRMDMKRVKARKDAVSGRSNAGVHLYLAESNEQTRQEWLAALDKIESLNPRAVVASHKRPENDDNPKIIEETRKYIRDFDRLVKSTSTAQELYDKMLALYPNRVNPGWALWSSVRAFKS